MKENSASSMIFLSVVFSVVYFVNIGLLHRLVFTSKFIEAIEALMHPRLGKLIALGVFVILQFASQRHSQRAVERVQDAPGEAYAAHHSPHRVSLSTTRRLSAAASRRSRGLARRASGSRVSTRSSS